MKEGVDEPEIPLCPEGYDTDPECIQSRKKVLDPIGVLIGEPQRMPVEPHRGIDWPKAHEVLGISM
jgi:hypothetical protein